MPGRLGPIYSVPTTGKQSVNLGYKRDRERPSGNPDWFEREGLRVMGPNAHMRNNPRLLEQWNGKHQHDADPLSSRCAACGELLSSIYGYSSVHRPPNYKVVKIETDSRNDTKFFCWECAASRQTMIDSLPEPHWRHYIADDGDDVFGFIEQTIFEDHLADELGIRFLQCHAGKMGNIAEEYRKTIGGRLLTLRDKGQYPGPIRPPGRPVAVTEAAIGAAEGQSTVSTTASQDASPSLDVAPPLALPDVIQERRERRLRQVLDRPGQGLFREQLIEAYAGRCAITDCDVLAALQAAHITPVGDGGSDHPSNGLLLRADVHNLFDLGLIGIDSQTLTVIVAPDLRQSHYADLAGANLRQPVVPEWQPSREALDRHLREWALMALQVSNATNTSTL